MVGVRRQINKPSAQHGDITIRQSLLPALQTAWNDPSDLSYELMDHFSLAEEKIMEGSHCEICRKGCQYVNLCCQPLLTGLFYVNASLSCCCPTWVLIWNADTAKTLFASGLLLSLLLAGRWMDASVIPVRLHPRLKKKKCIPREGGCLWYHMLKSKTCYSRYWNGLSSTAKKSI